MGISIKRNFIYNLVLTGSNLLFPLLTFPYLSRVIGAEGLGTCNFILSFSQNFIIVAALGLPMYGMREVSRMGDDKEKRSALFYELLFFHILLTFFILVIYTVTVLLYSEFQNYKELTIMGGVSIFLNIFTIEWLFGGVSDFKFITIRSLIIRVISVGAIFIFVRGKSDINIYFAITVLVILLSAVTNINYARKYISGPFRASLKNSLSHFKPISLLGMYMVLTSIYSILPMTLLGFFSTTLAVGYFYGANKIVYMTISVFTALTIVLLPKMNNQVENNENKDYSLLIDKAFNVIISLGIPITFIVYLLAEPIVMLLAGSEFVNSILILKIMSPLILIIGFAQVFVIMILNVNRRDKEMVILSAIGMGISLLIHMVFIARFAERASAFAQVVSELLVTIMAFFVSKKFLNFVFPSKLLFLNILFALPFIPLTYLGMKITDSLIMKLIITGTLSGIYFIFYQMVILKDRFLLEIITPIWSRFKKNNG
jgi:O-antigen/teichoic acid export membrane protein